MLVGLLLGHLQRCSGREDQVAAEPRCQAGQEPRAATWPLRCSPRARPGELLSPKLGVTALGLGEPSKAARELRVALGICHRLVNGGAIQLRLDVRAIA